MYSQAAIDLLSTVVDQEASSIVRYLEEIAKLRSTDEVDAEIQDVLEQLYSESCLDMGAVMELLGEHAAVSPSIVSGRGVATVTTSAPPSTGYWM